MEAAGDRLFVGTVQDKQDRVRCFEERWYRVPVTTIRPDDRDRRWPPQWFAGWQTSKSTGSSQVIDFVAPVLDCEIATREQLFPGEKPPPGKAGREYYRLSLGDPEYLRAPIVTTRRRTSVFIHTTRARLDQATSINDLWDLSPLEDRFWEGLKLRELPAERQWPKYKGRSTRFFDFAIFCNLRDLAVEVDGKYHHTNPRQSVSDSRRDADAAASNWHVIRFDSEQIVRELPACLDTVEGAVESAGGLKQEPPPEHAPTFSERTAYPYQWRLFTR